MTIYRQYPESRIFRYCAENISGTVVSAITPADVPDIAGVAGADGRNGPYTCLMSITLNQQGEPP